MSAAQRVEIVFGPQRIEVEASLAERRGGLRIFAREAERQLGLAPNTFNFYDGFGKVDTPAALQRAVGAARGVCQIEIREHTESKIMREMREAMQSLEERMTVKMEEVAESLHWTMLWKIDEAMGSVRQDLEPAVKSVTENQNCLRSKIDNMLDEMLAMREDALAGEDELSKRFESLAQDCLAMRVDALAGEEELIARLNDLSKDSAVKDFEHLEEELQAELDGYAVRAFELDAASENLEQLLADVRSLEQRQECERLVDNEVERPNIAIKKQEEPAKSPESSLTMPWEKIVKNPLAGASFSSKVANCPSFSVFENKQLAEQWDGLRLGFQACAPFAHGALYSSKTISRFHAEGLRGIRPCRSTPLLTPLH